MTIDHKVYVKHEEVLLTVKFVFCDSPLASGRYQKEVPSPGDQPYFLDETVRCEECKKKFL